MTREERLLRAIATRSETARRLEGSAGEAVLRSVVEATVALFEAEAASIALFEAAAGRLVFEVAAGEQGQGVIGLSIAPDQGIAGYVFTTGQALALSDVASDPRFGRSVAEKTGYIPRSIVAVPLVDDEGTIGVLQVLDKRTGVAFSLRDVELAGVFARQASVAIRASRVERDTAALLRATLRWLAGAGDITGGAAETELGADDEAALDALVRRATDDLAHDETDGLWRLADRVARLRDADPASVELLVELLDVLVRRAEKAARSRRRGPGTAGHAHVDPDA